MRDMWVRAVAIVVAAATIAGCSSSSDDDAEPGDLGGEFSDDTVEAAVDLLAASGVPVRVRPDDEPMSDVDEPSPVEFLRFQVRNMALEANHGAGTPGADLDALVAAADGAPIAPLIAGWAQAADTPASRAAAELLPDLETTDPADLVVPGLVSAMFLADITAGAAATPATDVEGIRVASPSEANDFCQQVATYLSSVVGDLLNPDRTPLEPRWLQDVIDRHAPRETDPQRIRNSVGALALLVYATSISRPWVPLLVANPTDIHYTVAGDLSPQEGELNLVVDAGKGSIADEAVGCAALADVQLTESELEGSDVGWLVPGMLSHVTRHTETGLVDPLDADQDPSGDLELDENGAASFGYEMLTESADAHKKGTLNQIEIPVGAIVVREEIKDVRDVVKTMLTGGELGVAAPEVQAAYNRLQGQLDQLLYPRASAKVLVNWHTPKPPDDDEDDNADDLSDPNSECVDGCAATNGDPHLVPVEGSAYDFQAPGEFTLLRSPDGDVEIQARHEPAEGSTDVAVTSALAAKVGDRRLGIYQQDGTREIRLDGEPVDVSDVVDLGGEARLAPYENGLEVDFPDGTTMWVIVRRPDAVEAMIRPSDTLRSEGVGLLGATADEGYGLPPLPDGSVVPAPADEDEAFDLMYGEYAEAWRVTDSSSLFDYESGESPDSFLVDGFPSRPITFEDLTPEQRAAGEAACADVIPELLQRQCIFDVAVTGDLSYAEAYEVLRQVFENAADGLGEPGPVIDVPIVDTTIPPVSSEVTAVPETTTAPDVDVAEPREGEPTATMSGDLVASYSEHASDDGVVTEMSARIRAEEGTVLLARADTCPADATVFLYVTNVEDETMATPFVCDPLDINAAMADEDDELVAGETYVWLPKAGEYDVQVDTDGVDVAPINIELFTDPTPTVVAQDELLADGQSATLAGVGDTIVYTFDGTATGDSGLTGEGLDIACAVEAYGAEEIGVGAPWALSFCAHGATAGSGLASGGVAVPLVVFSRTDDEIPVELTPAS